jgi:hypothetical protein
MKQSVFVLSLGLSLYYIFDFSLRQTVGLLLLTCLFSFLITDIWKTTSEEKNQERFIVHIRPNWFQILLDHRLITGEEEWKEVMQRALKTPENEYSALRDGFTFTVLNENLFYLNNEKRFDEKYFSPSIVIEQIPSFIASHPTWGGYEFSLLTPRLMTSTEVKLAFLTTLEFSWAHKPRPLGWIESKEGREQVLARAKSLEENGWKRTEKKDEMPRKSAPKIEHKYFVIDHQSL